MENPQVIVTPAKKWTLIDKNNQGGFIHQLKFIKGRYLLTYRTPGSTDPILRSEGAPLFSISNTEKIVNTNATKIYIWSDQVGRIRLDKIPESIGLNRDSVKRSAFGELITAQNELLCGWTFPININPGIIDSVTNTENGGSITQSTSFAVLQTSVEIDGQAQIQTIKTSRYIPGCGGRVSFTAVFDTPEIDSEQGVGLIDDNNGWAFGYNGIQFGLLRRNDGVDNWIYQDTWNRDIRSALNPQKGNVYEIKYQWLGFGAQYFSIENDAGDIAIVHVLDYANINTDTSVGNPNLPLRAWVKNKGNNTNLTLRTASASAGMDGDAFNAANSVDFATGHRIDPINGTGQPIIALRVPNVWLTKTNQLPLEVLRVTFAAESVKPVTFRILVNPSFTGGTFSNVYEQITSLQRATDISNVSGGVEVGYHPVGKSGNLQIDLSNSRYIAYPGQTFVFVADTDGNADARCGVHIRQYL